MLPFTPTIQCGWQKICYGDTKGILYSFDKMKTQENHLGRILAAIVNAFANIPRVNIKDTKII